MRMSRAPSASPSKRSSSLPGTTSIAFSDVAMILASCVPYRQPDAGFGHSSTRLATRCPFLRRRILTARATLAGAVEPEPRDVPIVARVARDQGQAVLNGRGGD